MTAVHLFIFTKSLLFFADFFWVVGQILVLELPKASRWKSWHGLLMNSCFECQQKTVGEVGACEGCLRVRRDTWHGRWGELLFNLSRCWVAQHCFGSKTEQKRKKKVTKLTIHKHNSPQSIHYFKSHISFRIIFCKIQFSSSPFLFKLKRSLQ